MRLLILGCVLSLMSYNVSFADENQPAASTGDEHVAHQKADHEHGGKDCKHKKVKHGDHTDFDHDGQYHAAHAEHFDSHGATAKTEGADDSLKLATHEHKHGKKCGHKAVKHGDHTDYEHDGHYHAVHAEHFDDHGATSR